MDKAQAALLVELERQIVLMQGDKSEVLSSIHRVSISLEDEEASRHKLLASIDNWLSAGNSIARASRGNLWQPMQPMPPVAAFQCETVRGKRQSKDGRGRGPDPLVAEGTTMEDTVFSIRMDAAMSSKPLTAPKHAVRDRPAGELPAARVELPAATEELPAATLELPASSTPVSASCPTAAVEHPVSSATAAVPSITDPPSLSPPQAPASSGTDPVPTTADPPSQVGIPMSRKHPLKPSVLTPALLPSTPTPLSFDFSNASGSSSSSSLPKEPSSLPKEPSRRFTFFGSVRREIDPPAKYPSETKIAFAFDSVAFSRTFAPATGMTPVAATPVNLAEAIPLPVSLPVVAVPLMPTPFMASAVFPPVCSLSPPATCSPTATAMPDDVGDASYEPPKALLKRAAELRADVARVIDERIRYFQLQRSTLERRISAIDQGIVYARNVVRVVGATPDLLVVGPFLYERLQALHVLAMWRPQVVLLGTVSLQTYALSLQTTAERRGMDASKLAKIVSFRLPFFHPFLGWDVFLSQAELICVLGGECRVKDAMAERLCSDAQQDWQLVGYGVHLHGSTASVSANSLYLLTPSEVQSLTALHSTFKDAVSLTKAMTPLTLPYPESGARHCHGALVSLGRMTYHLGGYELQRPLKGRVDEPASTKCEKWAPDKMTWTEIRPLLTPRTDHAAVACREFIYVVGGATEAAWEECLDTIDRYNTTTDTWERRTTLPGGGRHSSAVVVVGDRHIFVLGGSTKETPFSRRVDRYDVETDTWHPCAPMLQGRYQHAAAVMGDHIYVSGGSVGHGSEDERLSDSVERLCISSDGGAEGVWEGWAALRAGRRSHAMVAVSRSENELLFRYLSA